MKLLALSAGAGACSFQLKPQVFPKMIQSYLRFGDIFGSHPSQKALSETAGVWGVGIPILIGRLLGCPWYLVNIDYNPNIRRLDTSPLVGEPTQLTNFRSLRSVPAGHPIVDIQFFLLIVYCARLRLYNSNHIRCIPNVHPRNLTWNLKRSP